MTLFFNFLISNHINLESFFKESSGLFKRSISKMISDIPRILSHDKIGLTLFVLTLMKKFSHPNYEKYHNSFKMYISNNHEKQII